MKAIWKARKGTLVLLAIMLGAMLWSYLEVSHVTENFQRVFAPKTETTTDAKGDSDFSNGLHAARVETRDVATALEGACTNPTLYAVQDPASVSGKDAGNASARLLAIDESYYGAHDFTLYCGRLIYPDEFLYGQRVVMLDEQLAVALFQYAEPLERIVTIGDADYTVVGILSSGKKVGSKADYSIYAPYRAMEASTTAFTELVYEATPVEGAGGWVTFESETKRLGDTGTTVNLSKEGMNAAMPQRMYVCFLGFVFGLALIRRTLFHVKQFMAQYRQKLQTAYAIKLMPWLLLRWVVAIACFAAGALLLAQLFVWLIAPVYTFPEWVPAVLVEPKDIQTAFWNVWRAGADMVEMRTAELTRLRFLREVAGWSTGFAAFLTAYVMGTAFPKLFSIGKGDAPSAEQGEESAS